MRTPLVILSLVASVTFLLGAGTAQSPALGVKSDAPPFPSAPGLEVGGCLSPSSALVELPFDAGVCAGLGGEGGDLKGWPWIYSGPPGIICWDNVTVAPGQTVVEMNAKALYVCCAYDGKNPHPLYCFESSTRVDTA